VGAPSQVVGEVSVVPEVQLEVVDKVLGEAWEEASDGARAEVLGRAVGSDGVPGGHQPITMHRMGLRHRQGIRMHPR